MSFFALRILALIDWDIRVKPGVLCDLMRKRNRGSGDYICAAHNVLGINYVTIYIIYKYANFVRESFVLQDRRVLQRAQETQLCMGEWIQVARQHGRVKLMARSPGWYCKKELNLQCQHCISSFRKHL